VLHRHALRRRTTIPQFVENVQSHGGSHMRSSLVVG
jgi:hypothetical protein